MQQQGFIFIAHGLTKLLKHRFCYGRDFMKLTILTASPTTFLVKMRSFLLQCYQSISVYNAMKILAVFATFFILVTAPFIFHVIDFAPSLQTELHFSQLILWTFIKSLMALIISYPVLRNFKLLQNNKSSFIPLSKKYRKNASKIANPATFVDTFVDSFYQRNTARIQVKLPIQLHCRQNA